MENLSYFFTQNKFSPFIFEHEDLQYFLTGDKSNSYKIIFKYFKLLSCNYLVLLNGQIYKNSQFQ
jgi:hypothetical protein